ncbi:MAG: response regulator [Bacillota bacterium]
MRKVLLVDDEALQRLLLARTVQLHLGEELEILEAGNGAEAVESVLEQDVAVVIMDLNMPVLNGLEASRRILAARPEVKVIILTAYDEFRFAQEAVKLGAVDYLLKPVHPSELVAALRDALAAIIRDDARRQRELELRRQLETALPIIGMEYVSELISGQSLDMAAARDRAHFLGLAGIPSAVLSVGRTETLPGTEAERQLGRQQALEAVRELLPQGVALAAHAGGGSVAVVVVVPDADPARGRKYLLDLGTRLVQGMRARGFEVNAGTGRISRHPPDLSGAYREAVRARSYCPPRQVLHVDDIEVDDDAETLPAEAVEELLRTIRLGDPERAQEVSESLQPGVVRLLSSGHTVAKLAVLQLLLAMVKAGSDGGADKEAVDLHRARAVEAGLEAGDPAYAGELLTQGAQALAGSVKKNRNARNLLLVKKALRYLEREYARDITLEEIASVVHLSPYYFSHIFKDETGHTFVEKLTSIRIARAKQLLATTQLSVTAISRQVGYRDLNYFCRVFKKSEGVTPRRYRQNSS